MASSGRATLCLPIHRRRWIAIWTPRSRSIMTAEAIKSSYCQANSHTMSRTLLMTNSYPMWPYVDPQARPVHELMHDEDVQQYVDQAPDGEGEARWGHRREVDVRSIPSGPSQIRVGLPANALIALIRGWTTAFDAFSGVILPGHIGSAVSYYGQIMDRLAHRSRGRSSVSSPSPR